MPENRKQVYRPKLISEQVLTELEVKYNVSKEHLKEMAKTIRCSRQRLEIYLQCLASDQRKQNLHKEVTRTD